MRLGNFWGLTAPMILIIFDDDWDVLHHYFDVLNNEANSILLADVQQEFLFLRNILSTEEYKIPEVEQVIGQMISAGLDCNCGKVSGKDEVFVETLITEITFKVISKIIKSEKKMEFKKVPDDLRGFVAEYVRSNVIPSRELATVSTKIFKALEPGNVPTVSALAVKFHLQRVVPEYVCYGNERTKMTPDLEKIWQYFAERLGVINQIIEWCTVGDVESERVFNVPFFSLIQWKPSSIQYKILDAFSPVEDRQTADLVKDCKERCAEEIQRYRECFDKYVVAKNTVQEEDVLSEEQLVSVLSEERGAASFFVPLFKAGVRVSDYQEEDLRMLCDIFARIRGLKKFSKIFGIQMDENSVGEEAVKIGICGLNTYSLELFREAIFGITLVNRGKIEKSPETIAEIEAVIRDVQALLDSIQPVGEVLL